LYQAARKDFNQEHKCPAEERFVLHEFHVGMWVDFVTPKDNISPYYHVEPCPPCPDPSDVHHHIRLLTANQYHTASSQYDWVQAQIVSVNASHLVVEVQRSISSPFRELVQRDDLHRFASLGHVTYFGPTKLSLGNNVQFRSFCDSMVIVNKLVAIEASTSTDANNIQCHLGRIVRKTKTHVRVQQVRDARDLPRLAQHALLPFEPSGYFVDFPREEACRRLLPAFSFPSALKTQDMTPLVFRVLWREECFPL